MDGLAPCDALERPPPRRYRPDSPFRRRVELRNHQLLETMRAHPGASTEALAAVLGISKSALAGLRNRLGRDGLLVRSRRGLWRPPTPGEQPGGEPDEEAPEFETSERAPLAPFVPGAWCSTSIATSGSQPACSRAADMVDRRTRASYSGLTPSALETCAFRYRYYAFRDTEFLRHRDCSCSFGV